MVPERFRERFTDTQARIIQDALAYHEKNPHGPISATIAALHAALEEADRTITYQQEYIQTLETLHERDIMLAKGIFKGIPPDDE
jgi:hypothetical protein